MDKKICSPSLFYSARSRMAASSQLVLRASAEHITSHKINGFRDGTQSSMDGSNFHGEGVSIQRIHGRALKQFQWYIVAWNMMGFLVSWEVAAVSAMYVEMEIIGYKTQA